MKILIERDGKKPPRAHIEGETVEVIAMLLETLTAQIRVAGEKRIDAKQLYISCAEHLLKQADKVDKKRREALEQKPHGILTAGAPKRN